MAELPFRHDDEVLYEKAANHFLNGEARGGKVVITRDHIAFRPHRFNVQLDTRMLPLKKVRSIRAEGSRFIVIDVADQPEEWMVVLNAAKIAQYLAAVKATEADQRIQRNLQLLSDAQLRTA